MNVESEVQKLKLGEKVRELRLKRRNTLRQVAEKTGLWLRTSDLQDAVRQSDIVYTDTWVDMEFFNNPAFADEKEMRIRQMMPYQINGELLKVNPRIKIMHDMPIHTGYEISREAIESENAVIFQQAENRMWAQMALLVKLKECMSKTSEGPAR